MQNLPPFSQQSQNERKYAFAMQEMFQHLSNIITNLLKNLAFLYHTHKIESPVNHYHSSLMKMLMPAELISFIYFWCPAGPFKSDALSILQPKIHQYSQNNFIRPNLNFPTIDNTSLNQTSNHLEQTEFKKAQDSDQSQAQVQDQNQDQVSDKVESLCQKQKQAQQKVQRYGTGKYPFLQPETEEKLAQWTLQQYNSGRKLMKMDVARQAKVLTKIKNFNATHGWIQRFLKRHPQLNHCFKKQRNQYSSYHMYGKGKKPRQNKIYKQGYNIQDINKKLKNSDQISASQDQDIFLNEQKPDKRQDGRQKCLEDSYRAADASFPDRPWEKVIRFQDQKGQGQSDYEQVPQKQNAKETKKKYLNNVKIKPGKNKLQEYYLSIHQKMSQDFNQYHKI